MAEFFFRNNKHDWPAISRLYRRKAPIRAAKVGVKRLFSCSKLVSNSKRYNVTLAKLESYSYAEFMPETAEKSFQCNASCGGK